MGALGEGCHRIRRPPVPCDRHMPLRGDPKSIGQRADHVRLLCLLRRAGCRCRLLHSLTLLCGGVAASKGDRRCLHRPASPIPRLDAIDLAGCDDGSGVLAILVESHELLDSRGKGIRPVPKPGIITHKSHEPYQTNMPTAATSQLAT